MKKMLIFLACVIGAAVVAINPAKHDDDADHMEDFRKAASEKIQNWVEKEVGHFRGIPVGCLSCICRYGEQGQAATCPEYQNCTMDVGSLSCGPYQIKDPYYTDCGKPGSGWKECTTHKACSETCVDAYMSRYATKCTSGRTPTCEDYARIHNGGPKGCTKSATLGYWNKVKVCCDKFGGCD